MPNIPAGALLWLPVLVGGALRFYHALQTYGVWMPPMDRGEGYYEGAVNFLSFHLLSSDIPARAASALRGPLFPGFIVMIESWFTTPSPGHVRVAQAVLSTLTIAVAYGLGASLVSPWAGFLAALLIALDFEQILAVGSLDLNSFYAACMMAVTALLVRWAQRPSLRSTAYFALVLAASFLCRTSHYLLPVLICAACPLLWGPALPALRWLAALLALFLLFMVPYTVRNAVQFRRFVPLDTGAGSYRLYASAIGEAACCDDEQLNRYRRIAAERFAPDRVVAMQELEPLIIAESLRTIRARPLPFIKSFLHTMVGFWQPYAWLLLIGFSALWRDPRSKGLQALWLVLLSFLGYHVMVTSPWHAFVVRPLVFLLCGCGLASLTVLLGRRLPLRSAFFLRPKASEAGSAALGAVVAASYLSVVFICVAEFTLRRSPPDFGRALALLNMSVNNTAGRYALAERGQLFVYMDRPRQARDDLLLARELGYVFPFPIPRVSDEAAPAGTRSGRGSLLMRPKRDAAPAAGGSFPPPQARAAPREEKQAQALLLQDQKRCPEALAIFERLIREDPGNAKLYSDRSVCEHFIGLTDEAIQDLGTATRLNPGAFEAYLSLGAIFAGQGRHEEAALVYSRGRVATGLADFDALAAEQRRAAAASARERGRPPASEPGSWESAVSIGLDPRVELHSIVRLLADAGAQRPQRPLSGAYADEALRHFSARRRHPAVLRYSRWLKDGARQEQILEFLLYATRPPEMKIAREPWEGAMAGLPAAGERERLLAELRDFSRRSRFPEFFAAQRARYEAIVAEARAEVAGGVDPDAMMRYLGGAFHEFHLYLAPLIRVAALQQAMRVEPRAVHLARFEGQRGDFSLGTFGMSLAHELAHTVTGDWSGRWGRELRLVPAPPGCSDQAGNAWSCLDEYVVRAVEQRLLLAHLGRGQAERPFDPGDFPYQAAILKALERYEADRKRYPTLDAFYPRIIEEIRSAKLAESGRGRKPGQGESRP